MLEGTNDSKDGLERLVEADGAVGLAELVVLDVGDEESVCVGRADHTLRIQPERPAQLFKEGAGLAVRRIERSRSEGRCEGLNRNTRLCAEGQQLRKLLGGRH